MTRFFILSVLFLSVLSLSLLSCTREEPKRTPATSFLDNSNIVLIILDTAGANHIEEREGFDSPAKFLNKMSREGVSFSRAFSQAPWTRPSIASIFTGVHPHIHGVRSLVRKMKPEVPTLAEKFKERGYQTAGFVSHEFISPATEFRRGFDTYELVPMKEEVQMALTSHLVADMGTAWVDTHLEKKKDQPFLLFLHFFDPHYNYQHHEAFDRTSWYKGKLYPKMPYRSIRKQASKLTPDDVRYIAGLHEEEIAYVDSQIRKVTEHFHQKGIDNKTIFVVTADHGEEFLEHGGLGHGRTMYDELLRVPLVFWAPGRLSPRRVDSWVTSMDIYSTLLGTEEGVGPAEYRARSLRPYFEGGEMKGDRFLFADVDYNASLSTVFHKPWKYTLDRESKEEKLFNLDLDPGERENRIKSSEKEASIYRERIARAEAELKGELAPEPEVTHEPMNEEELKKLRSLGYID